MRHYLIAAAVLGFLAVLFGAFGAHALKQWLSVAELASWKTAVQYQMFHGLCIIGLVVLYRQQAQSYLSQSAGLMLAGTLLFSGSLYLLLLLKWRWLGPVTPLGGVLLLTGWLRLLVGVVKDKA
ncbi:DUF423 domain-containing protein [Alteromonadaceae bacterium BrNp21-10]|nr:DUF423 domain-containing protein [Alteromonadaceae bacterium BrNp21-10]